MRVNREVLLLIIIELYRGGMLKQQRFWKCHEFSKETRIAFIGHIGHDSSLSFSNSITFALSLSIYTSIHSFFFLSV